MKIEIMISKSGNTTPGFNIPKSVTRKEVGAEAKLSHIRDLSRDDDILEQKEKLEKSLNDRIAKRTKVVMGDFKFGTKVPPKSKVKAKDEDEAEEKEEPEDEDVAEPEEDEEEEEDPEDE